MFSNKKRRTVIVDTSFLINLFDDTKTQHQIAKKYYEFFLKNSIDMLLSPIVVAEFHQGQSILDVLSTQNFMPLPYNLQDGIKSAESAFNIGGGKRSGRDGSNPKYMDDIKIIGQAVTNDVDFIITADTKTLKRYCDKLNTGNFLGAKAIDINEAFDSSIFNGGQTSLNIDATTSIQE